MIITEHLKRIKSLMKLDEQSTPSNPLMTSIAQLIRKGGIDVNTLGKKFSPDVQTVQKALLSINPNLLPRYGADGIWGTETINALRQFNSSTGKSGGVDLTPDTLNLILRSIESRNMKGNISTTPDLPKLSSQTPTISQNNPKTIKIETIDITSKEGEQIYSEVCQRYIDKNQPNPLDLNGKMFADSAKQVFLKYGSYIPPEIALAQLTQEGGIRPKSMKATPVRTLNPFNIGNWDSKKNTFIHPDGRKESRPKHDYTNFNEIYKDDPNRAKPGVLTYYDNMARNYLPQGSDPNQLLNNFVNVQGKRYASDDTYEKNLKSIAKQVNKITNEVTASNQNKMGPPNYNS